MKISDKTFLKFYRKLIKFYPKSYLQDYEGEMVETMQMMISEATTASEKWGLLWVSCKDYLYSLTRQNLMAFDSATSDVPDYLVASSKFSTGLVIPFFIICLYNWLNQYLLHLASNFVQWESKTWVIYCVILPVLAGLVLFLAGTKSLIESIRNSKAIRSYVLVLAIPLSLLILIILM